MHRVPLAFLGRTPDAGGPAWEAIHGLSVADASPARRTNPRVLLDGAARLQERSIAGAREQHLAAIAVDPALPEAYNGVRVTHRIRNDLDATDADRGLASLHGTPTSRTLVKARP